MLNKCITQAGEDQPVKYNFDILEDKHKDYDQKDHDPYTLVWMVSSQSSESVLRTVKAALNLLFLIRKYRQDIAIVCGNWMAAECRLLNFVIVILTIRLFCIALY